MKALLIWLLIVICGVGVVYAMHQDPGYILIAYHHTSLEMTVWFGVVALIVGLLILRFVWGVLAGLVGLPGYFRKRHSKKAIIKSQALLQKSLLALVNGQYQTAAHSFKKGAKYQDKPLVNYLGGALALQNQGKQADGAGLLEKALKKMPQDSDTIYLMLAQIYVNGQCFVKALEALNKVSDKQHSEDLWIALAMHCYMGMSEWKKAYDLYPQSAKNKSLKDSDIQSVYQSILIGCLGTYAVDDLADFWLSLPKTEKQKEAYVWLLADRYLENDRYQMAAAIIMQQLKVESTEDLWELLASCVSAQSQAILHFCQKQLRHHTDQWAIYFCAAMAVLEEGDLNQAKAYLTQSVALKPTEHALLQLADICHKQGLTEGFQKACLDLLAIHQGEVG
jgi:HemY protein